MLPVRLSQLTDKVNSVTAKVSEICIFNDFEMVKPDSIVSRSCDVNKA